MKMFATSPTIGANGYTTERFEGGYIVWKDHGTHIELVTLSIERAKQGHGLGSEALRYVKAMRKPILLIPVAMEMNRDADLVRFYARHGFVEQYPGSDWLQWKP